MTKYTKGGDMQKALKAEDYNVDDVITELASIESITEVKDAFNAGKTKTVGLFIDNEGEIPVFINRFSMDNLIEAYGDENGEIEDTELIGKSVTITVVNDKRTRNKNAFEIKPYQALSVEELNNQRKLNGIESEPESEPEPRTAVKPPAASKPAESKPATRTARKPA